jgi:hypothetical protein
MAGIITKDDDRHPTHPAYKKSHTDAAKNLAAETVATEEKNAVKVSKRETPPAKNQEAVDELMAKPKDELLEIAGDDGKASMNKDELVKTIIESKK